MLHDPEIYPDPITFNPERFLHLPADRQKIIDPRNFVFGFGRRSCPGAQFADNALFIAIATILVSCRIQKKQIDGKEITPMAEYNEYIGRPAPFVCDILLRSEIVDALLHAAVEVES